MYLLLQLPYYIDGEVKLTQSKAILRCIARKHNLVGTTEEEKIRLDLVDSECEDLRSGFTGFCYNPNFVRADQR
jgi:glutathione S-transferase